MPKSTFDYTEFKANLNEFLRQVEGLGAAGGAVTDEYVDLCYAIQRLGSKTDYYYTPKPDGTFPAMKEEDRLDLIGRYYEVVNAIRPILALKETDEVTMAMKDIANQMTLAIVPDLRGLETVNLSRQEMTLPELVSLSRTQAVDVGQQKVTQVGGMSNSRMYLRLETGDGVQNGYFTPTTVIAPKAKYDQMLADMKKKYPSMASLVGEFGKKSMSAISKMDLYDYPYMEQVVKQPKDKQVARLNKVLNDDVYGFLELNADVVNQAARDPQFYAFSLELMERLKPIYQEYIHYSEGHFVDAPNGGNIDRRNLAMYRMAGLLGKQHLIPETKLVTVIQNGRKVTGTFMAEAKGVDCNNTPPDHPIMTAGAQAFENPSVISDVASMQVLDYICGNVDRHPGNMLLRFDPPEGENMKLVGISLIDNDLSFGTDDATGQFKGTKFIPPQNMGVVGLDTYNAMKIMTREQMDLMLAECRLSKEELDAAWLRKENLVKAIEKDLMYFADKEPGYTEDGRVRLVPNEDWDKYSMDALSQVHQRSQFGIVRNYAKVVNVSNARIQTEKDTAAKADVLKQELGIPVPPKDPEERIPTTARSIGTGLEQEPNPLGLGEDTLNLALPSLSNVRTVGDNLSKRYVLTYQENGVDKTVFYTPPQVSSAQSGYNAIFAGVMNAYPQFQDELSKFQDYYRASEMLLIEFPTRMDRVPWEKIGFTPEEAEKLEANPGFKKAFKQVGDDIGRDAQRYFMLMGFHQELGEGRRMELRNVAMSDVGDLLGTGDLLCRSRTVRVMSDGKVTEGVVMDLAKGEDPAQLRGTDSHPMQFITAEQAKECYNQPGALKQIADMQILDYVCLNVDRHYQNLFYEYEGLGTDHPRLVGIQGIDNDGSFGAFVPNPDVLTDKLPALNKMQVISKEMWEKIQDPQLPDKVAETVLKRGMTQKEADAAKQRIQMVKDAVNSGKLRIVEPDAWAKGDNTFEKLSAEGTDSMFRSIRYQLVDPCAVKAAAHAEKGEKPVIAEKKPFKGTMCAKVDGISQNLEENAEMAKLESEAEHAWQQDMKNNLQNAPDVYQPGYAEYVKGLEITARTLKLRIDEGNPFFSFTSKTYKNMIKACNELVDATHKAVQHINEKGEAFNAKDAALINEKLNKLRDASATYTQKKNDEIARNERIKPIGYRRRDIARQAGELAALEVGEMWKMKVMEQTKLTPFAMAQTRLKEEQGKVAALKGNALKEKVAEILYLKSMTKVDTATREDPKYAKSLLPEHIKSQKAKIMSTPEFKSLCNIPEDKLRILAAGKGANNLMKEFKIILGMGQKAVNEFRKQQQKQNVEPQKGQNPEPQKSQPAGPAPM